MTVSLVSCACAASIPMAASSTIPAAAERREIMFLSLVSCSWSQHRSGVDIPPPERRLHFAADLHGGIVRIVLDVRPLHRRTLRDITLELHVMRKSKRKQALVERTVGRRLLAPDAEPAL